jgi:peptide/nickel transport system ATP-binding protein
MSTADDSRLLLSADGCRVTYGSGDNAVQAVRIASIRIGAGEHVAIVGESGSGKTTFALAIAGLLTDAAARIEFDELAFDGTSLTRQRTGHRKAIPTRTPGMAMVFQDAMTSLDPVATIGSQFSDVILNSPRRPAEASNATESRRKMARRIAAERLASVGLSDARRILRLRPYELSGGMRQRVMLALAMCSRPRLLIADEPTSALDASVSREVMDLLRDTTEANDSALLIVTHDIALCREYVDKVIVMYHGEVVDVCQADRIEETATHPYTLALTACVPDLTSASLTRLPTLEDFMDADTIRQPEAKAIPA